MKQMLLGTAAAAAFALPAFAESHGGAFLEMPSDQAFRASDFIGARVYATENAVEGDATDGVQDGWEDIGEINDVLMNRSGSIEAVLVDVGGFLGIGERQIAIAMGSLDFIDDNATQDNPEDYFLVLTAARAMIEEAPEFMDHGDAMAAEEAAADPAAAEATETETADAADATDTAAATAEAGDGTAMATAEATTEADAEMAPADEMAIDVTTLTAENLIGTSVNGPNDERVGEIGDVILTAEGQVEKVVIDVGGFLGIGEKPVAMNLADLEILREGEDGPLTVRINRTQEELEALPVHEG